MKRISFFLVLTLILISFGLANAAKEVYVDYVEGEYDDGGPMLTLNSAAVFHIHVTNDGTPDCFFNPAFGFQVCDDAGTNPAAWTGLALDFDEFVALDTIAFVPDVYIIVDTLYFDANFSDFFIEYQPDPSTGSGCDSVGVAGVASAPPGLNEGMDLNLFTISFTPTVDDSRICLDIAAGMPSYEWNWSGLAVDFDIAPCEPNGPGNPPDIFADWGGPYCFGVGTPPDQAPVIGGGACAAPPTTISGSHCATLSGDFCAEDPDPGQGPGPDDITYGANIGTMNATTGHWTSEGATFDCEDEDASITLVVYAYEADNAIYDSVLVNINVTNETPTFASGCGAKQNVGPEEKIYFDFTANDDCGDPLTYDGGAMGTFDGTVDMVGNTLEVTPGPDCPAGEYDFWVTVKDCEGGDSCHVTANVILGQEYEVVIEKTELTPQGQFEEVAVSLNQQADEIGGFNFLIAYDASALTFQGATPGPLFDEEIDGGCDWEYFTYRYGPDGNCGNACPSGLLRVVGIAETNNGPYHPACFGLETPYDLFYLSFLVSNNRTFECAYVPIRFFWIECGDNSISSKDGTTLYISSNVMEYSWDPTDGGAYLLDLHWTQDELDDGVYGDPPVGMPWYKGADWTCDFYTQKGEVAREVGFYNGGIDIICAGDIDDRGDINQNGLAYEIADAVMFSNYFIYGLGAFTEGAVNGSIAATDVNADGLTLSVADLVYLIRVIVGDALPYDDPFLKPTVASYTYHNGVVSVNAEMGAAAFTFDGDVDVELLASDMELKYHFDGEVTRAVVYSLDGNTFSGDVVRGSNMVTLELGSADGAVVVTNMLPSEFSLSQNYPNPFNPTTTAPFALPVASDVTLTVYNVTGQVVAEMGGTFEAGEHSFEIDGSNLSSGIYFYRLDAGSFTATKKMVLLK